MNAEADLGFCCPHMGEVPFSHGLLFLAAGVENKITSFRE